MKETPLSQKHIQLGAKMAEFAGYNMPIVYSSIIDEHQNIRNNAGVFDVSHMGEFIIKGKGALDLIQSLTSNDVSKLEPGDVQYSCLPNETGGIVDDLLVYRLDAREMDDNGEAFMLVVNAGNIQKDWDWIATRNTNGVSMENISDKCGLLAVQGPKATEILQKLTDVPLSDIKYYNFRRGTFAGVDNVIISATGYTGAGGFEIYADSSKIEHIWDAVFAAGKDYEIKPTGLGARDTLRLEMGFCLYGNDIDDTTSPLEAGLGWITKLNKGAFSSSDLFNKQKKEGVSRKLVGFTLSDRRVPRHGYIIKNESGEEIGVVTSGTLSPSLEYPIGMGYVTNEYSQPGSVIHIDLGKKTIEAKIVKVPFIKQ